MSRQSFYDRRAKTQSLNSALALTVAFGCYGCIGVFQVLKYFQGHDPFYLFVGLFTVLLGAGMVAHGFKLIHAIVRRLIAESHSALPLSDPTGN